jgi:phytoene dehydrogenase-like protein
VILEGGREIKSRVVLSNADPKRTFLGLVDSNDLPDEFREKIRGIKMAGPCAKVNMVLSEEPKFKATPPGTPPQQRSLFTLVGSLEFAERCYDIAKFGQIPEELWVDCVVASNVDDSLAPLGKHILTCFVQYVPYRLAEGTWDQNRDLRDGKKCRNVNLVSDRNFDPGGKQIRVRNYGQLRLAFCTIPLLSHSKRAP